jgi:hypothetical protein
VIQVTDTDSEVAVNDLKRLIPTDKFKRISEVVYTISKYFLSKLLLLEFGRSERT